MIVHEIEVVGVAFFEAKDHSPVTAYCKAPVVGKSTLQSVQPPAREQPNFLYGNRGIYGGEHIAQLIDEIRGYAPRVIVLKESLQTLVAKGSDRHTGL